MHNNSFSDANDQLKHAASECGWADMIGPDRGTTNIVLNSRSGSWQLGSLGSHVVRTPKDRYFDFVEETFKEMLQLIKDKSHDYSEGDDPFVNFRTSEDLGVDKLVGLNVRLLDKVARIKSFSRSGNLKNESIKDAYKDLIGYAVLALGMIEEGER